MKEAIRYLEFCVEKLGNRETAIHNFLLSLYAKQNDKTLLLKYLYKYSKVCLSVCLSVCCMLVLSGWRCCTIWCPVRPESVSGSEGTGQSVRPHLLSDGASWGSRTTCPHGMYDFLHCYYCVLVVMVTQSNGHCPMVSIAYHMRKYLEGKILANLVNS